MSLYNMIHGVNPMAGALLAALGLAPHTIGRFRDCYWDGTHICVHTRTGGGNREGYQAENDALCAVAGYSHDADDDFDSTYATFYFKPSAPLLEALKQVQATDATPAQRWQGFFDKLQGGIVDEQTKRVSEAMKPVIEHLVAAQIQAQPDDE